VVLRKKGGKGMIFFGGGACVFEGGWVGGWVGVRND
jgi:hypothetical protein